MLVKTTAVGTSWTKSVPSWFPVWQQCYYWSTLPRPHQNQGRTSLGHVSANGRSVFQQLLVKNWNHLCFYFWTNVCLRHDSVLLLTSQSLRSVLMPDDVTTGSCDQRATSSFVFTLAFPMTELSWSGGPMLRIRRTNWVSALNLLALDPFSVRNSGVDKQIPRGRRSGRLDSL